jgi:hypothetical protein
MPQRSLCTQLYPFPTRHIHIIDTLRRRIPIDIPSSAIVVIVPITELCVVAWALRVCLLHYRKKKTKKKEMKKKAFFSMIKRKRVRKLVECLLR